MNKTNKSLMNTLITVAVYATAVSVLFFVLYYVIVVAKGNYHSDCTDTIFWAEASLKGKGLIDSDYSYAALMPFGGSFLMLPFVAMFGVTLKAQILGMTFFTLLFIGALFFMLYSMKLGKRWTTFITSIVMVTLLASDKLREIFFEHIIYYSLGMFFVFLCIALTLRMLNRRDYKNKKTIIDIIFLVIVCAFAAANGMQIVALSCVPVLAAVLFLVFFDVKKPFLDVDKIEYYIAMVVILAGIIIGLLMGKIACHGVKCTYAKAYSGFSESSKWADNFLSIFANLFTLLGVSVKKEKELFSLDGILNLIRIFYGLIILVAPIIMTFQYKKIKDESYKIIILVHHVICIVVLLGWIFGNLNAANWRLSPIVVSGTITTLLFVRWIMKQENYGRIAALILIPVFIMSCDTLLQVKNLKKTTSEVAAFYEVIDILEENDLEKGYATFWNAGIVTLLSDSKVKVRNVKFNSDGVRIYYYQTNINWYHEEADKYFVIVAQSEKSNYVCDKEPIDTYSTGEYIIYVYGENLF